MSNLTKGKNLVYVLGALVLVLVVVLVLNVAGVLEIGAPQEEMPYRTERIVIGFTPPDITGVFKTATDFFIEAAADARAAGIHVEVIARSPATHLAYADQVAIVEDFIAREVDVIAISPTDVAVMTPVLQKANAAGIPIVAVNLLSPIEGVDVESYIGVDNFTKSVVAGYTVLDYFGGPGVLGEGPAADVTPDTHLNVPFWEALYANVDPATVNARGIILEGIAGSYFSNARLEGFRSVIQKFPNVVELGPSIATDWNRAKSIAATEDVLTRFGPGEIDFIWGMSNEVGLGAMLAVEAAGRQDDVRVFNQGGTAESLARVRDGRLTAETWQAFPEWGWYGTKHAVMVALGLEPPFLHDAGPRTIHIGNVEQFFPLPHLEPIDWEAILQAAGK